MHHQPVMRPHTVLGTERATLARQPANVSRSRCHLEDSLRIAAVEGKVEARDTRNEVTQALALYELVERSRHSAPETGTVRIYEDSLDRIGTKRGLAHASGSGRFDSVL